MKDIVILKNRNRQLFSLTYRFAPATCCVLQHGVGAKRKPC